MHKILCVFRCLLRVLTARCSLTPFLRGIWSLSLSLSPASHVHIVHTHYIVHDVWNERIRWIIFAMRSELEKQYIKLRYDKEYDGIGSELASQVLMTMVVANGSWRPWAYSIRYETLKTKQTKMVSHFYCRFWGWKREKQTYTPKKTHNQLGWLIAFTVIYFDFTFIATRTKILIHIYITLNIVSIIWFAIAVSPSPLECFDTHTYTVCIPESLCALCGVNARAYAIIIIIISDFRY